MQHRNGMNKEIDSLDSGESPNNIKEGKKLVQMRNFMVIIFDGYGHAFCDASFMRIF